MRRKGKSLGNSLSVQRKPPKEQTVFLVRLLTFFFAGTKYNYNLCLATLLSPLVKHFKRETPLNYGSRKKRVCQGDKKSHIAPLRSSQLKKSLVRVCHPYPPQSPLSVQHQTNECVTSLSSTQSVSRGVVWWLESLQEAKGGRKGSGAGAIENKEEEEVVCGQGCRRGRYQRGCRKVKGSLAPSPCSSLCSAAALRILKKGSAPPPPLPRASHSIPSRHLHPERRGRDNNNGAFPLLPRRHRYSPLLQLQGERRETLRHQKRG